MSRVLAIYHVPHERLGTFQAAFVEAGCALSVLNACDPNAEWPRVTTLDGAVVMGGPMSAYEQPRYPFLTQELAFLRQAIERQVPLLGVCLGAQLLAAALGARVTKNPQKEIGWYPLRREPEADGDPLFEPFGSTETVFQWHGDTFELPQGAVRLASSPLCAQQAFRYGERVYGLQFHVEVTEAMIRAWMRTPGNREELASLRGLIDPMAIRRQSPRHVGRLAELSRHVALTWVRLVDRAASGRDAPVGGRRARA